MRKRTYIIWKWILAAVIFIMPAGSLSACSVQNSNQDQKETLVLTDDLGRQVSLPKTERAAVLIGSFADLLRDAGGQESIVSAAHDAFTRFGFDDSDIQDLGDVKNISVETLAASEPDYVIASAKNENQKAMQETLESMNIPVLYYDVSSFDDYLRVLKDLTEITQDESAYEKNGLLQKSRIEAIQNKTRDITPTALALRVTSKGVSALTKGSVLPDMLEDLKVENAAEESLLDHLSMEEVVLQDPDYIFIVVQNQNDKTDEQLKSQLLDQPAWKSLKAVKEDHVYILDSDLYNLKPNARWAQAEEDLEKLIYGQ